MTADGAEGGRLAAYIGARLHALREERGVSRAAAARALDLSEQAYANREAGVTEVKACELVILAGLLRVDPWALFDGADAAWSGPAGDAGPLAALADEAEEFLRLLACIRDPDLRLGIIDAIRTLARAAAEAD
ncbi:MAG: hypothetical protein COW30_00300 [Rhodospirillales bacterium CG15_BIG_FIL_POST_REV_8_21_14_020_66_15]|nr:MAG: hypothetical protein COW30_00300 [Rhodospirillales bacterium CG15_BIG_FIL_POST_REV_8_21_14_020_66_15]